MDSTFNKHELAAYIDATLLSPTATKEDVGKFVQCALGYPFASVCVPPCHLALASGMLKGSGISASTVVGFPLGYQATGTKLAEVDCALRDGAAELDVVMNISAFLSGDLEGVSNELKAIVRASAGAAVKVIIEACYLTDDQKKEACRMVVDSGAGFVKTSTGFGPSGATAADVRLLKETAGGKARVKAAGGIKDLATALEMINAGADRVGTSSASAIMEQTNP